MPTKEQIEQVKVREWVRNNTDLPFIYIPNDGKRSPQLGLLMKRMGLCPGASDIFIPRATKRYHGLFIELKAGKNKPTLLQLKFIDDMIIEGYGAYVAYGAEEAIAIIKQFYVNEITCA